MNIQLKNIKFSEAMSEETNAFVADVYVNDVKVAYAKNDGHGGSTFYHAYEGKRELLKQAEQFCLGLPSVFNFPMNLEFKIDLLLEDWLKPKTKPSLTRSYKRICSQVCV